MRSKSKSTKLAGAGFITAILSSLCCITPVLALLAGASGIASSFSWLEPVRPYLIGITFIVLGFAWYKKLKPRTAYEIQCDCEKDEKPSFWQSKKYLGLLTIFAITMLTFPYYGQIFYPKTDKQIEIVSTNNIQDVKLNVKGMTCSSCEEHVKHAINELPGIISVSANHLTGTTIVKFDITRINRNSIIKSIDATGYTVTNTKEL